MHVCMNSACSSGRSLGSAGLFPPYYHPLPSARDAFNKLLAPPEPPSCARLLVLPNLDLRNGKARA